MLASLTFLTPAAGLVAILVVVPLAAFAVAASRVARVRSALGLPDPQHLRDRRAAAAAALVVLLLALTAAQPALTRGTKQRVRTDAQVLFVVDISQSMAASSGPKQATRLDRATREAERLRAALPEVPAGVATLTDRVLPDLLPVADSSAFDATMRRSIAIEQPAPFETAVRATDFGALAAIPNAGYFDPSARHRVVVLLTDGETRPYDAAAVSKAYGASPRAGLVAVRFWRADEAIYRTPTRADPSYRPDPSSAEQLAGLAAVTGGRVFQEGELAPATEAIRGALGSGPTHETGRLQRVDPLGPYVALAALLPLAFLFSPRAGREQRRAPERSASVPG